MLISRLVTGVAVLMLSAAPLAAQDAYPAEGDLPAQPRVDRPLTPLSPERLEQMVPKHPGYLGREHSDPDLVVPSYNGESVGRWEGDTLVVHTKYFETDNHYIDLGIPISDQFELIERIRLVNGGKTMEVEYELIDPQMWEGEWKSVKRYNRADYTDINEANCILQYNANLPGTNLGSETAENRGQSHIEGVSE